MNIENGKYVVYGTAGVCRVDGIETKCFDGVHEKEYCRLCSMYPENSVYYIPKKDAHLKVRDLIAKEEAENIINRMEEIPFLEIDNEKRKKEIFNLILKSGDFMQLTSMLKFLYLERQNRMLKGKKLNATDEKAMHDAENLMYREFAFVFGIKYDEIIDVVHKKFEQID